MGKTYIVSIVLLLLSGLVLYFCGHKVIDFLIGKSTPTTYYLNPIKTGREGERIPSFNILLTDSISYIDVSKVQEGKPAVLFYFGPDCPFCQAEIRSIIENIESLKDIQFYLLTPYSFSDMKRFEKMFRLERFSNIKIGVDYGFFFGRYFQTNSIPFLAIYSKENKLKEAFMGNVQVDQIKAVAEK